MPRKILFILFAGLLAVLALSQLSAPVPAAGPAGRRLSVQGSRPSKRPDFSGWFIVDNRSAWLEVERAEVESVLANTLAALESVGLDGEELLAGYRFRRSPGEFANGQDGKIALVNHDTREITLSDTVLEPENEFFIYHELGHIVDFRSGRALDDRFHALTLEIEGVTTLHDWTTAQGFFLRGQAHIKHTEATADAFALWVWVEFADRPVPHFHDTPENADPDAILAVFETALESVFPRR